MNKRMMLVLLVVTLVVSLGAFAACAKEEEAPPVTEEWQWPEKLMLGTSGIGDQSYAVGIGWVTLFGEDTGVTARVIAQPDMNLRYAWLRDGTIDITSLKQSGKPWIETAKEIATRDGGPSQMRGLFVSGKRDAGWGTPPGSGIKTPNDIKPGTRIVYPAYLGPVEDHESQMGLIAWAQVAVEDIVWVPASSTAASPRLLMDGKADVVHVENTVGGKWYEAASAPRGLAFIDLDFNTDPEGAARYAAAYPDVTFAIITNGIPEGLGRYGMTSMGPGQVMADLDPELVYRLVKWLNENHDLYKANHPILAGWTIENVMTLAETYYMPHHEATVRYLQELGAWTPKAETNRQYFIDLMDSYISAYQQAIDEADSKGIAVEPKNKEWIDIWYSYKDQLPLYVKRR